MVKVVFDGSHFLLNGHWWLERGLDLFLTQDFGDHVSQPLNVRKVSDLTEGMVVKGPRPISCSFQGFSYLIYNVLVLVAYAFEDLG